MKPVLTFTFDFDGMPDYYSGHGHAFDNETVVCYRVQTPISYLETTGEIIDEILSDLNSGDFEDIINEEVFKKYETEIRALSDSDFESAIRAQLKPETKDSDAFFEDPYTKEEREEMEKEEFFEGPVLIGFFHVTLEE